MTQLLARHAKDGTTLGYVNKLPYRAILDDKIREYQNTIEVILQSELKMSGKS